MKNLKGKLTFANLISCLALFVALGGAAYAATNLPKNSVGTKQIKKGAVTGIKIKKGTITGTNINLAKLGTVPSASTAATAGTANALAAMEPTRLVGASGQPPFLDGSSNFTEPNPFGKLPPVGFFKDHDGVVHLEGVGKPGTEEHPIKGLIFQLPSGDRPASGVTQLLDIGGVELLVFGSNVSLEGKNVEGDVFASSSIALLSGATFRAES
jgi:hypothetical protein